VSEKQPYDKEQYLYPCYEIRLKGLLDDRWAEFFDGMTISVGENGDTLITSPCIDQAALHGLIKKVRDLGMQLLSVNQI
jgi:hypothetical protein